MGYQLQFIIWNIRKMLAIFYKQDRLERDDTEGDSKHVGRGLPVVTLKNYYVDLQLDIR